jgi:hypothetical protein
MGYLTWKPYPTPSLVVYHKVMLRLREYSHNPSYLSEGRYPYLAHIF